MQLKKTVPFTMLEKGDNHVTREYLLKLQSYNRDLFLLQNTTVDM